MRSHNDETLNERDRRGESCPGAIHVAVEDQLESTILLQSIMSVGEILTMIGHLVESLLVTPHDVIS